MPVTASKTIAFGPPSTKTCGRPNCRINGPGEGPFRIGKPSMWSAHWPLRKARWPPQMQHSRPIASGYFLRSAAAGKQMMLTKHWIDARFKDLFANGQAREAAKLCFQQIGRAHV